MNCVCTAEPARRAAIHTLNFASTLCDLPNLGREFRDDLPMLSLCQAGRMHPLARSMVRPGIPCGIAEVE